MRTHGLARKTAAVGISLLMLTLSVAVPVLEQFDLVGEPVAESEHNPATCPPAHDHTVCTQVSANLATPTAATPKRLTFAFVGISPPADVPVVAGATFAEGHPSRAPPLA